MNGTIEPATQQDAAALEQLVNSAYRNKSKEHGWTAEAHLLDGNRTDAAAIIEVITRSDTKVLKYVEDGEIIGCVELRKVDDKLYLGMLSVRPNLQGKGIGKALIKEGEAHAKKQNCTSVFMTVISIRQELLDWYFRHGYLPTGQVESFPSNYIRFGPPNQKLEFLVLEKKLN
jgi:predicted N-acetyltransferase YhbS